MEQAAAVSRDGQFVAFLSARDGQMDVWVTQAGAGQFRECGHPDWRCPACSLGSSCTDQCPMHMANIGAALKKLPSGVAGQVKLVFVTTDPARDTPLELRRWLDNFDKDFVGLTGTETALEAVRKAAGGSPRSQNSISRGRLFSCARQFRCRVHEGQSILAA